MRIIILLSVLSIAISGCKLKEPDEFASFCNFKYPAGWTINPPAGGADLSGNTAYPAIVFHHGAGLNWSAMGPDMAAATNAGYYAISLNSAMSATYPGAMPGNARVGNYPYAARQAECAIRTLRSRSVIAHPELVGRTNSNAIDPQRVAFYGYSIGGQVGYILSLPNREGREKIANFYYGADPTVYYSGEPRNESGRPNALIAISAPSDSTAAVTAGLILSNLFVQRMADGTILTDADGRPMNAEWVNPDLAKRSSESLLVGSQVPAGKRLSRIHYRRDLADRFLAGLSIIKDGNAHHSWAHVLQPFDTNLFINSGAELAYHDSAGKPVYINPNARTTLYNYNAFTYVGGAGYHVGETSYESIPVLIQHSDFDEVIHASNAGLAYDFLKHKGFFVKYLRYTQPSVTHQWGPDSFAYSDARARRNDEAIHFLNEDLGWQPSGLAFKPCDEPGFANSSALGDWAATVANSQTFNSTHRRVVNKSIASIRSANAQSVVRACADSRENISVTTPPPIIQR